MKRVEDMSDDEFAEVVAEVIVDKTFDGIVGDES